MSHEGGKKILGKNVSVCVCVCVCVWGGKCVVFLSCTSCIW